MCVLSCQISKSHKTPFSNNPQTRKSENFQLVFSNVLGPMPTTFLGGQHFAISFVDSFSRFGAVYFMKSKSESLQKIKVFRAQVGRPKLLPTDNGTEYTGKIYVYFCIQKGIKREFTAPYSPHQNGVYERPWRTTVVMARCLLKNVNLEN